MGTRQFLYANVCLGPPAWVAALSWFEWHCTGIVLNGSAAMKKPAPGLLAGTG
jgi:hypothetical protein